MPRCIYCLLELPEDQFNTEHIVPRQLGSFEKVRNDDPLTLLLTVCADCNSYFGKTIELAFGRDSIEAVYRLKYGQKRPREFQGFNSERVVFRVPDYMPAGGVVLTPAAIIGTGAPAQSRGRAKFHRPHDLRPRMKSAACWAWAAA